MARNIPRSRFARFGPNFSKKKRVTHKIINCPEIWKELFGLYKYPPDAGEKAPWNGNEEMLWKNQSTRVFAGNQVDLFPHHWPTIRDLFTPGESRLTIHQVKLHVPSSRVMNWHQNLCLLKFLCKFPWESIYDMGTSQNLDAINCNDFLPKWYHFRANRGNLMLWHTKGPQNDTTEKYALMLEWRKPMKYPMISISYKIIPQLWDTDLFCKQTANLNDVHQFPNRKSTAEPFETHENLSNWTVKRDVFGLSVVKLNTDA